MWFISKKNIHFGILWIFFKSVILPKYERSKCTINEN